MSPQFRGSTTTSRCAARIRGQLGGQLGFGSAQPLRQQSTQRRAANWREPEDFLSVRVSVENREVIANTFQKSSPFPMSPEHRGPLDSHGHLCQSVMGWPHWHLRPCCLKPEFPSAAFLPPLMGDQLLLVSYGKPAVYGAFLLEVHLAQLWFSTFVWLFD